MAVAEEGLVVTNPILLVEDERIARESLARLLKTRGYDVVVAESGAGAILHARNEESSGVVLMDISLGIEMDGIEAAHEIQTIQPLTSFIFVSAYANDPTYRERIRVKPVRVGGWLEKPIKIEILVELIQKELYKLRVLRWLQESQAYGKDPIGHLLSLESSLPAQVFEELLEEVQGGEFRDGLATGNVEELRPLKESQEGSSMDIAAEIDAVYGEIHSLVIHRSKDPDFLAALHPLRKRLEELQELEAEAMERRLRAQLHFDPVYGRELIERAEKLLRKR